MPGKLATGWVLASETPALDVVGADFVRELEPGEMVVIDRRRASSSLRPFPAERVDPALCAFEFVYFARPDGDLRGVRCTAPGSGWASRWPSRLRSPPTW